MADDSKESIYASIGAGILGVSILIAGFFYFSNINALKKSTPVAEIVQPTDTISPTPPQLNIEEIQVEAETALKIGVPNEAKGLLLDPEGRETGYLGEDTIVNDIPFSEYSPDAVAGTVTWIIVENPSNGKYILNITGSSDKAVAVYVKNKSDQEQLELIDISSEFEEIHSVFFDLDTSSSTNSIVLGQ